MAKNTVGVTTSQLAIDFTFLQQIVQHKTPLNSTFKTLNMIVTASK